MTSSKFSVIDYAVFVATLVISAIIGFFYAWKDTHVDNVDQVLLGGRNLNVLKFLHILKFNSVLELILNNFESGISSGHVYHGQLHISSIHSWLFSRNVQIRLHVFADRYRIFYYPAICCSGLCAFFPSIENNKRLRSNKKKFRFNLIPLFFMN